LVISSLALFVSLGGVGYAAATLPAGSVGSAQLQNESVSYQKIVPSAVGIVRANTSQLQARVSQSCGLTTAIGSIAKSGQPQCVPTLPQEAGVSNTVPLPVPSTLTMINNLQLQGTGSQGTGSYLVTANPTITITGNGTAQRVTVSCTLTVGAVSDGGTTQTRSATIDTGSSTAPSSTSIPLQLAGGAGDSEVSCASSTSATPAATASVSSALNAIQVAS
jgi:hypothetical protein